MSDELTRRRFFKYGLATLSAFIASAVSMNVDKSSGFQVGRNNFSAGMSEANAQCGIGMGCSGGGGQCGIGMGCSGGGGQCGIGMGCSGGGGQCGIGMGCAGQ